MQFKTYGRTESLFSINDKQTISKLKALEQVGRMVERNGGKYFTLLEEVADYLNSIK